MAHDSWAITYAMNEKSSWNPAAGVLLSRLFVVVSSDINVVMVNSVVLIGAAVVIGLTVGVTCVIVAGVISWISFIL